MRKGVCLVRKMEKLVGRGEVGGVIWGKKGRERRGRVVEWRGNGMEVVEVM